MTTEPSTAVEMTADERLRMGIDIDIPKLKEGLRELSNAFVSGRQGSYGMRIPAEPYRDGDLVCGGAFRVIERLEQQLTAAESRIAEAVQQEREACRAIANMVGDKKDGGHSLGYRSAGWEIAELIKGRGANRA